MSNTGFSHEEQHEEQSELRREQEFIDGVYARVDALRGETEGSVTDALAQGNTPMQARLERDILVAERSGLLAALNAVDGSLCFGRLDLADGAVHHIGRIGLREDDTERTPILIDGSTQNYGSRDVGRWGSINRARFTGLTGMGDMTTVSFYSTPDFDEQKVLQLAHEFRVGGEGLRFGASYTYAWTRPDIAGLPVKSDTQIVSLYSAYPLVLTQARRVTIGGGLDFIDQDIALAGVPINEDRLRVFNLRADASWIDPASIAGRGGYSPSEPRWSLATSLYGSTRVPAAVVAST